MNAGSSFSTMLSDKKMRFVTNVGKLEALNPLSVLTRGYSVVQKNGENVSTVEAVSENDSVTVRIYDGKFVATVTKVIPGKEF